MGRRVVAVAVQEAAHQVQEAVERPRRGGGNARGVGHVDRLVAVLLDDLLELAGRGVDGLVPADALVLALAAGADALHGVVDAVGTVGPAPIAAAAQAGASFGGVEGGVGAGVGVHPGDLVVLHVHLQRASAGAVDGAVAPRGGLLGLGQGRGHVGAEQRVGCRDAPSRCRERAQGPGGLEERAAAQLRVKHANPPSSRPAGGSRPCLGDAYRASPVAAAQAPLRRRDAPNPLPSGAPSRAQPADPMGRF